MVYHMLYSIHNIYLSVNLLPTILALSLYETIYKSIWDLPLGNPKKGNPILRKFKIYIT